MTITYSISELRELVAAKLGMDPNTFRLIISRPYRRRKPSVKVAKFTPAPTVENKNIPNIPLAVGSPALNLVSRLLKEKVFEGTGWMVIRDDKHLEAIRTVRQYYSDNGLELSVANAKKVIQNWIPFLENCEDFNLCSIDKISRF